MFSAGCISLDNPSPTSNPPRTLLASYGFKHEPKHTTVFTSHNSNHLLTPPSPACSYAYNTFNAHLSQQLLWQRVTLHAAAGMGVYTEGCSDITLDECAPHLHAIRRNYNGFTRLILRQIRGQATSSLGANVSKCRRFALLQH